MNESGEEIYIHISRLFSEGLMEMTLSVDKPLIRHRDLSSRYSSNPSPCCKCWPDASVATNRSVTTRTGNGNVHHSKNLRRGRGLLVIIRVCQAISKLWISPTTGYHEAAFGR